MRGSGEKRVWGNQPFYFIRTMKNQQTGYDATNEDIEAVVGTERKYLTDNIGIFRFSSKYSKTAAGGSLWTTRAAVHFFK